MASKKEFEIKDSEAENVSGAGQIFSAMVHEFPPRSPGTYSIYDHCVPAVEGFLRKGYRAVATQNGRKYTADFYDKDVTQAWIDAVEKHGCDPLINGDPM